MATDLTPQSETWEELVVPPEVQLGTPPSDGQLQEESTNVDNAENADENATKIKV
jgi:hypothetical protein